jgi:hypothetical protein
LAWREASASLQSGRINGYVAGMGIDHWPDEPSPLPHRT